MPTPMNTVVQAATENTTSTPQPSSSTNWWIVVIIVLLSIAIVVVALLTVVWCRRIRRSGSVGVPTPVHTSQPYVTIRGLRHSFGAGIDVEKGDVTQLPGGTTEEDISPHDDSALVVSEQGAKRAKRGSGKSGLFNKVFDRRRAEPRLVGYRNRVHEPSETTPLRRDGIRTRAYDSLRALLNSSKPLSNRTRNNRNGKHRRHPVEEDYDSMSMSSLSSEQHEAGLFEYVVKMSHGDGKKKSSNRFIPVRYRTTVHPWAANPALVATPDVLKEFEKERSSSDEDVPPVKLRPVKYPHREPESPVNDVTSPKTPAQPTDDGGDSDAVTRVTKETKAPADDPVVPSDTASEPTRDEPTAGPGGGENRVIAGGSQQEEEEKERRRKAKEKKKKKKKERKDKHDKHERKRKESELDLPDNEATPVSDKHQLARRESDDQIRRDRRKKRHSYSDVDGYLGRNMRAAPRRSSRSQSEAGDIAVGMEEQYHSQNVVLHERMRLARRRQHQQLQLQVVVQEMLNKTYLRQQKESKERRRRDTAQVKQLLSVAFPLAGTTIGARKYCMAQVTNSESLGATSRETKADVADQVTA